MPRVPTAFHVMAKPTGAVCNLDCEYCFFLAKEMLYPGSRFRMAEELQESYLRQLLEAHAGAPEVVVAWQGGEPTMMGLDFFRRSCVHAETCGEQIALEHNGDVYSCDHYVEPDYLLGDIGDRTLLELVAVPRQQASAGASGTP